MFERIFKKFNKFYENIYLKYSLFLSKYYLYVICLSFIFNLAISFGIFKIRFLADQDALFGLTNSKAKENELYLKQLFSYNEKFKQNDRFYVHQLLDFGLYAEVNFHVALNSSENIISKKYIDDVISINKLIKENITIKSNDGNVTYKYADLCAKQGSVCSIEGETLLFDNDFIGCKKLKEYATRDDENDDLPLHIDTVTFKLTSLKYNLGSKFKYVYVNDTKCVYANLFKLRYALNQFKPMTGDNDLDYESLSKKWELEFIEFMNSLKLKSAENYGVSFSYSVSQSIEVEMKSSILSDIYLIAITISTMFFLGLLIVVLSSRVITFSSILLPLFGMLCAVGGITSAIGFLSLLEYPACELIFLSAFILIGKCLVDLLAIQSSLTRLLRLNLTMVEILARLCKKCDIGLGLNSLTIFIAFMFGLLTSFKGLQIFSVYTAVATLFCYFYQITFLLGWITVYLNRMSKQSKTLATCYEDCLDDETDESSNQISLLKIEAINDQNEFKKQINDETAATTVATVTIKSEESSSSLYRKIKRVPEKIYKFFIITAIGKAIVVVVFLAYLSFSIYKVINIEESLQIGESVSEKSYLKDYVNDFLSNDLSPPIMIVFPEALDYQNKTVVNKIKRFFDEAHSIDGILDTFRIMSPIIFDTIGLNKFSNETIESYKQNTIPILNDIIFAYNETTSMYHVKAVRFYLQFRNLHFNYKDTKVMRNLNRLCENFEYPVFAYSPAFKNIELFDQLSVDLMQMFVITVEIAFFLSFLFIFNLKSAFCISLSIASIFIGFCGLMSTWNISLSIITMVDFMVGLAISATSVAYIVHLFLIEFNGESKSERVYKVMKKYGISIAKAHVIMALTSSILIFSQSFSFYILFKTILIANLVSTLHLVFFIPVLLAIVGPHWKIHEKKTQSNYHI